MDWIYVVSWLAGTLIVVLGPIIVIHELGHYISAKLAGVRVEEAGLGFPPRMLKLWRGKGYLDIDDTRVVIPPHLKLGPLGKLKLPPDLLVGAHVEALAQRREDETYVLRQVRTLDADTEDVTPVQEQVEDGVRLRGEVNEVERGTLYSLNWLPIGAFVKMTGEEDPSDPRSLAAQPKRWRLTVIGAGIVLNVFAAFLLMVGMYLGGLPERWLIQVGSVIPGTAAAESDLAPGDVIQAIDGERIEDGALHVQRLIQAAPEQTVELTVLRGDETLTLQVTPAARECEEGDTACPEGTGFLGIQMAPWPDRASLQRYTLPEAVQASVAEFGLIARMLFQIPGQLAQGEVTAEEVRPTSVVGASQVLTLFLQQSVEWRLAFPVLHAAALISLAIGLTNLLPLPGLDGGRIAFVVIEAIRGRRIAPEREALVHFVGIMILVFVMLFIMVYDVFNPIISWSLLMR